MKVGDRVRENMEDGPQIGMLGTIEKISPLGYIKIQWDRQHNLLPAYFRPGTEDVILVTGEDARPRHVWKVLDDIHADPPCEVCGVIQTDANEREPCPGAKP